MSDSNNMNLDELFFPGVDPEFYTDDNMIGDDWKRLTFAQRTCVFCGRDDNHTEGMVYSATAGRAICTDCIDETDMLRREFDPEAREAWRIKRAREWEERVAREAAKHPPPPHCSKFQG